MGVYIYNSVLSYFRYGTFIAVVACTIVVYVIYETQKDCKVAPTFDVTSLAFANEDNEFSEFVFEVQ